MEHVGAAGSDAGRDIIGHLPTPTGTELWYFQCKRRARVTLQDLKTDLLKIARSDNGGLLRGVVFVLTTLLRADVRSRLRTWARETLSPTLDIVFWARTELDERVSKHPRLVMRFFQLGATVPSEDPLDKTTTFSMLADLRSVQLRTIHQLQILHGSGSNPFTLSDATFVVEHVLPWCRNANLPTWVSAVADLIATSCITDCDEGDTDGEDPTDAAMIAEFAALAILGGAYEERLHLTTSTPTIFRENNDHVREFLNACDTLAKSERALDTAAGSAVVATLVALANSLAMATPLHLTAVGAIHRAWVLTAALAARDASSQGVRHWAAGGAS